MMVCVSGLRNGFRIFLLVTINVVVTGDLKSVARENVNE